MVEIVRDQVVYNAGSHLEVACVYRNTTGAAPDMGNSEDSEDKPVISGGLAEILRQLEAGRIRPDDVPAGTIVWLHNGKRFSHRNRRR